MIALAKYLKGSVTIGELMNMPNRFIQCVYKEYTKFLNDPKLQEAAAVEEVNDALQGEA